MEAPECFNEFMEHEKVQGMLNGIRVNTLDATIEIIQASDELKNDYEKASAFILAAIGRHHEKNTRTGKAKSISATGTKPTNNSWNPDKGDKNQPWVNKNDVCDFRGASMMDTWIILSSRIQMTKQTKRLQCLIPENHQTKKKTLNH